MNSTLKLKKQIALLCFGFLFTTFIYAQKETATWKLQIGLGVNHAFSDGFSEDVYAQRINFPTINIGIQRMFTREIGAKLDLGFNRFKSGNGLPEFKTNYTRINAQFVYDPSSRLHFLPERMRFVLHAGPGITFSKPLGNYKNNNLTFLNAVAGTEFHYGISEKFSVFVDGGFVFGFSGQDLSELDQNGFAAFNGNMIYATVGISVSLSGCYYCND